MINDLLEEKQKYIREKEKEELRNITNEADVWKFYKHKEKEERMERNVQYISMEKWKTSFPNELSKTIRQKKNRGTGLKNMKMIKRRETRKKRTKKKRKYRKQKK